MLPISPCCRAILQDACGAQVQAQVVGWRWVCKAESNADGFHFIPVALEGHQLSQRRVHGMQQLQLEGIDCSVAAI